MKNSRDSKEDREIQKKITARANYSLTILGMAFVRHGSGRFLWLGKPLSKRVKKKRNMKISKKIRKGKKTNNEKKLLKMLIAWHKAAEREKRL